MEDKVENAIIERVSINTEERYLTMALTLKYGGGKYQGFGSYILYLPEDWEHHNIKTIAGDFIYNCLKIADVTDLSKMVGKSIRVKCNDVKIIAIGHIIEDFWFCPSEKYAKVD